MIDTMICGLSATLWNVLAGRCPATALLLGVLLLVWCCSPPAAGCEAFHLEGDPIGASSNATDQTGGFSAVEWQGTNLGQPAVLVELGGSERLAELRTVVFGVPTGDGRLRFDEFSYQLSVWTSASYFSDADPDYVVTLGDPIGLELVTASPDVVVPAEAFGEAGPGGSDALTYDLRFDLGAATIGDSPSPLVDSLGSGDWVLAFQAVHDPGASGMLRVAGSTASEGPIPLFSRDDAAPRGILGGQPPESIVLRWGMSVSAELITPTNLPGDFNGDGRVDAGDYVIQRDILPEHTSAAAYDCWRANFGQTLDSAAVLNSHGGAGSGQPTAVVPELSSQLAILTGILCLLAMRPRVEVG